MQEQTVVITGASGGIGRATARLFGERGARVVLIARGQAGLDGAAADVVKAGGKPLAIAADVADYAQVAAAAQAAGDEVAAAHWFERGRAACGPAGIYTEEYDVHQHQLRGNLPQAFVHAAKLESAVRLSPRC